MRHNTDGPVREEKEERSKKEIGAKKEVKWVEREGLKKERERMTENREGSEGKKAVELFLKRVKTWRNNVVDECHVLALFAPTLFFFLRLCVKQNKAGLKQKKTNKQNL